MQKFLNTSKRFAADEEGVATVWAISWLILCFAIAGLSIDITNAWKVKEILQSTADVAAHAGSLELGQYDNDTILAAVQTQANAYANVNMNTARYGDVLRDADIQVGTWDHDAKTFVVMASGATEEPDAVRVITRQDGTDGASNVVGTFFLRFVARDKFSVSSIAIAQRFISESCGPDSDGVFSFGTTNFSAQNSIEGRSCIYGEEAITFAQSVSFEAGTVAMTPDVDNCGPSATSCTDTHNAGIEAALTSGTMSSRKIGLINTYINELQDPTSDYQPEYISEFSEVVNISSADFEASDLEQGKIYIVTCSPGENLDMGAGGGNGNGNGGGGDALILSEFVLVGLGCDFVFDDSIAYEDTYFLTSADGRQTISGSSGVVLGRDDNCTAGGEVVFVTAGSVRFASKLEMYDVEMVVAQDMNIASNGNADSIHSGSSFYVGGDTRITSQHTFDGCEGATSSILDKQYSYRLVY